MSARKRLTGVLAAGMLAGLAGLAHAQQQPAAPQAPAVVVAPAKIMDLRQTVDFTGTLVAIQKIDVRARVSGFLEKINFIEGQKVKAGDVLYNIEDGNYVASVKQIDGQIAAAQSQRDLSVVNRDRYDRLVQTGAVPQSQLDEVNAQLGQIDGQIEQLGGSKDAAELQLSYTKVVAPFDGVTGLSAYDIGALVGPDSGPLTTLTRLDPMYAQFPVSTALLLDYREKVKKGEIGTQGNVEITLPNGTPYPTPGKVDFISSIVSQGTDTVMVRAVFDNPDGILLDGTLVRVTLQQSTPQEVLAVPQVAVQRDQAGAFVLVVGDDSKVELRRIVVDRNEKGYAVVSSGLKEGERVITEGVGKVRPGIVVDAALAAG